MQQPQGYEVKGKENLVCRLKKRLYGLKKAPRYWYLKFDRFMTEQGYNRCHSDHCVYFKKLENGSFIILLLYVDDMLVAGSNGKGKGKNKAMQWKPMVVERGKTCSRFKEKSNFNKVVGK
jgi:hypothetical protein